MTHPPGTTSTVWESALKIPKFPRLTNAATADVCIAGAGIAGLSVAYHCLREHRSVIVVDERGIGAGETGRTSAHLASATDDGFVRLEKDLGLENAQLFYQSHAAAIDDIEAICQRESIDCAFRRVSGYLFLAAGTPESFLDDELAAAHRAGFTAARKLSSAPVHGARLGPCLQFPNQAAFHPLRYLAGLARAVESLGGKICVGNRVTDIQGGTPTRSKTGDHHTITAHAAVAATNVPSPINNWLGIYLKQSAYRSYVIGCAISPDAVTDALYWDTAAPYHYVRLADDTAAPVLIIGGEDHKTGQAHDESARFERLESWAREHFPAIGKREFAWSGQVNEPDDHAAYIGEVPTAHMENVYAISGDSGMGLTHGALAGMLIRDAIMGNANPWAPLYNPARRPAALQTAAAFLKENVNVAWQYVDLLSPSEVVSLDDIRPNSGALFRQGITPLAVYKDPAGKLSACSALCTHLKCVVHWNDLEKSWDCPCHGSRFDPHGKVIVGPAIDDLPKAAL